MAGANPEPDQDEAEDWLVTYADAITILMAFFVMLVSFSKIDIPMFEAAMAGISNEIGMGANQSPVQALQMSIQDEVLAMQANEVVNVEVDDNGVVLELASGAFFKPASAIIRPQAFPVIDSLYALIDKPEYLYYAVEIEGHSDDEPISSPMYPSNWELAGARAARIVRYFIEKEMHPKRLYAISFGDTRPKYPNRERVSRGEKDLAKKEGRPEPKGKPIPKNQAKNRRIALRIYPMSMDQRASIIKEIGVERLGVEGADDIPMGNVMDR